MRKCLSLNVAKHADRLFSITCVIAAVCILAIFAVVMTQVAATVLDKVLVLLGEEALGWFVPSYAEITGFLRGASCWLALASALQLGNHVRVSLVTQKLHGNNRRLVEIFCLLVALVLVSVLTFNAAILTIESFEFGDRSRGIVSIPLWIPESLMTFGLIVMTLAIAYELGRVLRNLEPTYNYEPRSNRRPDAESLISD